MELARYNDDIIDRVTHEDKSKILPIAVIDNGADIAHPDLIPQMDFQVENNKIIGVGYDFMGDDTFPSANLINPELFAFVASEIQNGLIVVGDQKNPFEEMDKYDRGFKKIFLKNLNDNKIISDSIFKKINEDSFNVFGLYKFIISEKFVKDAFFSEEIYKDNLNKNKLIKTTFRNDVLTNLELQNITLNEIYNLLDVNKFNIDVNSGLSMPFLNLNRMEHGDLVYKIILKSFEQYELVSEMKNRIEQLLDFRLGRNHSITINQDSELSSVSDFLSKSLEYHRQKHIQSDPIHNLRDSTISEGLSQLDLYRKKYEYPILKIDENLHQNMLSSSQNKILVFDQFVKDIDKSAKEKLDYKDFSSRLNNVHKLINYYVGLREIEFDQIFSSDYKSMYSSVFRKQYFRTKHPYVSSFSEGEVHGTHTAGIVAKQNERIRIHPIRVTTRSALVTKEEKKKMIADFSEKFEKWLSTPIVVRAIYTKIPKLFQTDLSQPAEEPLSNEERKAFANSIMNKLKPGMDVAFEENPLDFLFFNELEKSFLYVAQKKIKIASISLGAENNVRIPKFSELDPDVDLRLVFSFLNFEFVKYNLAEILNGPAKNTLFVVAAGNSNTWIDGKTHSALPVDLTSRFLKEFEDGAIYVAPNNHINNLLGVGSLNEDHDLSDFTNVLLGTKTEIIFAVGEDVLSPIKTTDLSSALSILNRKFPFSGLPFSVTDQRLKNKILGDKRFSHLINDDLSETKLANYFNSASSNIESHLAAVKYTLAVKYSDHREKLSGTSMATPAVAGYIGDLILKNAEEQNVSLLEVYEHPKFSPQRIIMELKNKSRPLFKENPEINFRKVDILQKYERGHQIQKLDQIINNILK